MGNVMSAAYRLAKRYDCMDLPEATDPNAPHHADRAAGTTSGDTNDISGANSQDVGQDMVASLDDVKPSIRDFDGKPLARNYLEVYWPRAGGISGVNAIGTQLRDPVNSGLTRWRLAVLNQEMDAAAELGRNPVGFSRCYALGKRLGEGSCSEVFEATLRGSPPGSQLYAVKRTLREGLEKEQEKGLFEEVRILRMLQHSNVVGIYQFFKDDPKYYYVILEHMEGGELFDRIVQKMYYNEQEGRELCRVLIDSVRYCHELGIVHRNLKPENLLLTSKSDNTNIKLGDFSLACSVLNGNVTEQYGSPGYVAPEILRALPYGTSVDMWSMGVIIYTLLGGYPPFHDENQSRLFRRIKAGSFKFHDEYWSDISAEAKDFIRRLLVVDTNKRMTATQAVDHPWLLRNGRELSYNNLGRNLEQLRIFNAVRKLRAAVKSVIATRRMSALVDLREH